MPLDEPLLFLAAMEQDLDVSRYPNYDALREYMRGSASAVGLMMCHVLDVRTNSEIEAAARTLGEAMQLTNFLRDVGEDAHRGRIYLPLEDLHAFGLREADILKSDRSEAFVRLMKFEIERARELYALSDAGIALLPNQARKPVRLARILYSRILDRIEARNYDVFTGRARTSRFEKILTAVRVLTSLA